MSAGDVFAAIQVLIDGLACWREAVETPLPWIAHFHLVNSCIEGGIALGCDKVLYLTCRGADRTPPFMFCNRQVWFYEDDLDLIAKLRQIAAEHRRMGL